jgi:hypothetical protein
MSFMQPEIDDLNKWSKDNYMNINISKTKEMLIGHMEQAMPPALRLNDNEIERVHVYKLLGLHINNSLTWNDHVMSICTKTAKRLHFLKLLKRAAMSTDDLLHYYESVIRPVAEYACVVWHSSLMAAILNTPRHRTVSPVIYSRVA